MRRVTIRGKVFEINEDYYLNSISHLAKGYYVLAEAYHNYHVSGFADWKGAFQMPNLGQNEVTKALADQINDLELSKAFESLKNHLQEIKEVDGQIVDWLARFVGLSSVQDDKDKAHLEERLHKIVASGSDGRPQGPVWAMHPEYQALVERSKIILADMSEAKSRIEQRIHQLLESSTEE